MAACSTHCTLKAVCNRPVLKCMSTCLTRLPTCTLECTWPETPINVLWPTDLLQCRSCLGVVLMPSIFKWGYRDQESSCSLGVLSRIFRIVRNRHRTVESMKLRGFPEIFAFNISTCLWAWNHHVRFCCCFMYTEGQGYPNLSISLSSVSWPAP